MAPPSGDSFGDDRNRKTNITESDATRIVPRKDESNKETVILKDGARVNPRPSDPNGTLIGVSDIQQGVRVAGRAAAAPGAAFQDRGKAAASGDTVFLPAGAAADSAGGRFDPVVGWVVITKGNGKGNFRPVFYGQNSMGRGPDQRICLDYGDQRISREAHAFVIYDESQRKFYLRDNGKSNLVRHKGNLVMMPTELADRDEIVIGDTTLRFIALCDRDFDWLATDASNESPKS